MSNRGRRTKIVATLGPATDSPEMIEKLIDAGVNVFRLNFSHGDHEVHRNSVKHIREISARKGKYIGILQDLQGPKIRVERFENKEITLVEGAAFALTCDDDSPGNEHRVGVTYKNLASDVRSGDRLLLDDGRLELEVTDVQNETINTVVRVGGVLSNNKGINIPEANLSIPALTDKDVEDLMFGAELDVDWVAVSFVRTRDDLLLARHYLSRAHSKARLMAKIEKPSAVENFAEIIEEVDGIMVARGDLGVELAPERVPIIQKSLIRACIEAGKPVITATQMLESMIESQTPTRAEASDVANAIYDGTDAIMLSAETAVGQYPIDAVRMMDRIANSVEADKNYQKAMYQISPEPGKSTAEGVSYGAVQMAYSLELPLIVTFTSTGTTAFRVSRNRPPSLILGVSPTERALRQMAVVWGVVPMYNGEIHDTDGMVRAANECIAQSGLAEENERYVITAGVPFGKRGTTNLIRVEVFHHY